MGKIIYKGKNVYVNSNEQIKPTSLRNAQTARYKIEGLHFFPTNREKIGSGLDKAQYRLAIEVTGKKGNANISIQGLDDIVNFLVDQDLIGKDFSSIKGRRVTVYNSKDTLLGISFDN